MYSPQIVPLSSRSQPACVQVFVSDGHALVGQISMTDQDSHSDGACRQTAIVDDENSECASVMVARKQEEKNALSWVSPHARRPGGLRAMW